MALIDDSFLAGLKTRRRRITQASACIFLSSGRARLFAFEESNYAPPRKVAGSGARGGVFAEH